MMALLVRLFTASICCWLFIGNTDAKVSFMNNTGRDVTVVFLASARGGLLADPISVPCNVIKKIQFSLVHNAWKCDMTLKLPPIDAGGDAVSTTFNIPLNKLHDKTTYNITVRQCSNYVLECDFLSHLSPCPRSWLLSLTPPQRGARSLAELFEYKPAGPCESQRDQVLDVADMPPEEFRQFMSDLFRTNFDLDA